MVHGIQIVIDCADPAALAEFWAQALGYIVQPPPEGFDTWDAFLDSVGLPAEERGDASAIVDPEGIRPRVFFQRVPEPKQVKNRVHLDINASGAGGRAADEAEDLVEAHVERLVGIGATLIERRSKLGDRWVVMADPEGNEFCVQ